MTQESEEVEEVVNQVDERDISSWQQERDRFSQRSQQVAFPSYKLTNLFIECIVGANPDKTMISVEQYKQTCLQDEFICQCEHENVHTFADNIVVIEHSWSQNTKN